MHSPTTLLATTTFPAVKVRIWHLREDRISGEEVS
jgi:hypothetical protein